MSERSYYRAKKDIVERLAVVVAARLVPVNRSAAVAQATEPAPIALPMVDRLMPETIRLESYCGTDRARALSAAALCAEMDADQTRADTFITAAAGHVRNQFGGFDVAAAFEVAQNAFFIARCRGDLVAMRAALRTMARFRERLSAEARVKFSLDCSEVFLYEGRLRDAALELQVADLHASTCKSTLLQSIALVRRAQISLLTQDLHGAEEAGAGALYVARAHADIRVYAAEVLGRSALQTGSAWSSAGLEECRSVFHSLNVRTVLARHQLRNARMEVAAQTAHDAFDMAIRLRYWHLASRAGSTLALCLTSNEARPWISEVLRLHLRAKKQNAYMGADLFDGDARGRRLLREFLFTEDAVRAIAQTHLERFPDSALATHGASFIARLTEFILRGATDPSAHPSPTFASAAKRFSQQTSLPEFEREVRRLGNLVGALATLLPRDDRGPFIAACRRQTRDAERAMRRSFARYHWTALRY